VCSAIHRGPGWGGRDQRGTGAYIERVRLRWPQTRIIVRGDSGFCRDDLLIWCEAHDVDYVLGLAQNSRMKTAIAAEMAQSKEQYEMTQQAARAFRDFRYRTNTSWSCARRVIGKVEQLARGENPRFVVTFLSATAYEEVDPDFWTAR
jgi:DDE family transposase